MACITEQRYKDIKNLWKKEFLSICAALTKSSCANVKNFFTMYTEVTDTF